MYLYLLYGANNQIPSTLSHCLNQSGKSMRHKHTISHEICTWCFCLPCCGYIIVFSGFMGCIYPYPSGLLHWHWGNRVIAPVQVKQPWRIWVKWPSSRSQLNPTKCEPCEYISWHVLYIAKGNVSKWTKNHLHWPYMALIQETHNPHPDSYDRYIVTIQMNAFKNNWKRILQS